MRNIISLILFLFTTTFLFSQKSQLNTSKIDSSYFYSEKALFLKNYEMFGKALKSANKSIEFGQKNKNTFNVGNGYYTLALIHIDLKQYDLAIEKLIRAVSLFETLPPNAKLALSYYNLGICYLRKDNFKNSESYFEKANRIYDSIALPKAKTMISLQKGLIYLEKNNTNIAEKLFFDIAHLPEKQSDSKIKAEAFYELGKLTENKKVFNLSLNHYQNAHKLSIENKDLSQQIKFTKKISSVYDKMGQTKNSLAFLKINSQLSDSIQKKGNLKSSLLATEKVKIDEIIQSMEKIDKEKKQQEKSGKFSKLINILSIALITILSLLSLSLYKNNIIRNKSNELLRDKNTELEIAKERIEKASKARAEFLSTVSHELRTPLNAINGISHILLDDDPKESQIEYLKSLKFSGNYLLTFINEILEINRVESDNIEIEKIGFNLKELLNNIQNSLKEQASQNNNDFELLIQDDVPDFIIGDPTKLAQIFINLINNALKFTKDGTITVRTILVSKKDNHCKIKFEVQDTGIGIPLDKQESIFESFSQGSVEINRKYGGTGLGLTIVKKLVSIMGGKIKLISKVGTGSAFSFSLKFEISEAIAPSTSYEIIDENIFVKKSILLVEDNKINQMITKKIVEKKQMICELCETGEDAIVKMKNNKYDLVLMDVHLPGINGTIATEEIRKFDSKTPIIALTAISLDENREMLLSYGMNDVITKPFNPDNFYKIIETNLIENSQAVQTA